MILSLRLAKIRVLSYFFFLFLIRLSNFLIIRVVKEKKKAKLALAIPKGVPIIVAKEIKGTPTFVALKKKKKKCRYDQSGYFLGKIIFNLAYFI